MIDTWEKTTAFFLRDDQVEALLSYRLRQILNRPTDAALSGDSNYWDVRLTPCLTKAEIEAVFAYTDASAEIRADHELRGGVICDISGELATQIVSSDFPLPIRNAYSLESGIWFFSDAEFYEKDYAERLGDSDA
ncbi:MAG: hypothetical protein PHY23_00300 [Oscillospiraceae bacterium]|nr:hypothetical protein [Oscillospiraceae bacterium]